MKSLHNFLYEGMAYTKDQAKYFTHPENFGKSKTFDTDLKTAMLYYTGMDNAEEVVNEFPYYDGGFEALNSLVDPKFKTENEAISFFKKNWNKKIKLTSTNSYGSYDWEFECNNVKFKFEDCTDDFDEVELY